MFSYYGSKTNLAKLYPAPKFNKLNEVFAGSAKYSLLHFENDVTIVDKYETIVNIWKWLQICSKNDILKLPSLKEGEKLTDFTFDCKEQKDLMGFIISSGGQRPVNTANWRETTHRPNSHNYRKKAIADQLYKIKHWNIILGDYRDLKNENATWFVDPPYQFGGEHYVESNKNINFKELASWCKSRKGQTIVCENTKADWMNFKPMRKNQGSSNTKTTEAIWSNGPTAFDWEQRSLFS